MGIERGSFEEVVARSPELFPLNQEALTTSYIAQIKAITNRDSILEIIDYNGKLLHFDNLLKSFLSGDPFYLQNFFHKKRKKGAYSQFFAEIAPNQQVTNGHPDTLTFFASVPTVQLDQEEENTSLDSTVFTIKSNKLIGKGSTKRNIAQAGINYQIETAHTGIKTSIDVPERSYMLTGLRDSLKPEVVLSSEVLLKHILFLQDLPTRKR